MDSLIDDVPVPENASPVSNLTSSSPLAGCWVGTWGGVRKIILIVESIGSDGTAKVIYAFGDRPPGDRKANWSRYGASIEQNTLTMNGNGFTCTFELAMTGRLKAVFVGGGGYGILVKQDLESLLKPGVKIPWTVGNSEFLQTDLVENGEAIQLETVIYTPPGKGPFPLALFNHGSTGCGKDAQLIAATSTIDWYADYLNQKGWMVAFPQRRGRGRSGGLYDEGFSINRTEGYTCESERSLAGADRALLDVDAAVNILRSRPEVADEPILISGNSRGGILSIAYAGLHPEKVKGVINFVGGWLGEACETAEHVNQTLFSKGVDYKRHSLWIYGQEDPYYTISHSQKNFSAFEAKGGLGTFKAVIVEGESAGHGVVHNPPLWTDEVEKYLSSIESNSFDGE